MRLIPSWIRPPGPLSVWKVVDGYETLDDGTKKPVKFSIQEIPSDQQTRQQVLDLLYTHYLTDEPFCKSLKLKESDFYSVGDFQKVWDFSFDQGVVIGCYKLDSKGKIVELVGVNMIFITTPEVSKNFEQLKKTFKSEKFMRTWKMYEELTSRADVRKIYNVDTFIGSCSLSVLPKYRGQKLGLYLLDARSSVGKKYGVSATATLFSAYSSQTQARRLGYEEKSSINYEDVVDDKGNPQFPNIESKSAILMMKKLF